MSSTSVTVRPDLKGIETCPISAVIKVFTVVTVRPDLKGIETEAYMSKY